MAWTETGDAEHDSKMFAKFLERRMEKMTAQTQDAP
jgi:hypothetical protein